MLHDSGIAEGLDRMGEGTPYAHPAHGFLPLSPAFLPSLTFPAFSLTPLL
ncbi:MAG: hypothetical protein Q8L40_03310 [Burkholderiales bacterium]|nr:hypothetical protein [Burkholderiales bacterium]